MLQSRSSIRSNGLWSGSFVLGITSRTFYSIVHSLLTAVLAAYAFSVYAVDASSAGICIGCFIVASMFSRVLAGRFLDKVGRRRMYLCGSLAYFIFSLGYLLPWGFGWLVAVRVLQGFAFGVISNTLTIIAATLVPHERLGEGLGYFALSTTISAAVGPFCGILLYRNFGFDVVFVFCAFCCLISLVSALFMKIPEAEDGLPSDSAVLEKEKSSARFFDSSAIPISLLCLLTSICYVSAPSFVDSYAGFLGIADYAPWFFVTYAVVQLATRPFVGRLLDKRGSRIVLIPVLGLLICGLGVLTFASGPVSLIGSAALLAIGYGCAFSVTQAVAIKSAPRERLNAATTTFYIFADIGLGIGPAVMGMIEPVLGFRGMYGVAAAACLLIAIGYIVYSSKHPERSTSAE